MKSASLFFSLCIILFSAGLSSSSGASIDSGRAASSNGNCAATLSGDLRLHIPILSFDGNPFYADFEAIPDSLEIRLTSYGLVTDMEPFVGCRPSLLSPDLILHIPTILFSGASYLIDFEYSHDQSLALIGAGRTDDAIPYWVSSASSYQEGCAGPCLCPVRIGLKLSGTFNLVPINQGPLFDEFDLDEISWTAADFDGTVVHKITGFGIYRRGGELANMHRLILAVSIDGSNLIHFDSGLVVDGSAFPAISISVDRGTSCYDTFLNIIASPGK